MLTRLLTTARTLPDRATSQRERLAARRHKPDDIGAIARAMAIQVASNRLAELGRRSSYRSNRSLFSVLSRRSVLSICSAWSFASVASLGSIGSAGSMGSIGSSGSILSIGSTGSILSVGASGSIGAVGESGSSPGRESLAEHESQTTGPDVARISGLMAVAAVVAAGTAALRRAA